MRYPRVTSTSSALTLTRRIIPTALYNPPRPRSLHQSSIMSQQPEILGREEFKTDAKWLKLEMIKYKDQTGKERQYEVANRATRAKSGVDSVHILAILNHPSKPPSTILIEQYRPPVGGTVIEFPAGLVDEGEDARSTALRELYEETGYGTGEEGGNAKVEDVSSVLVKDPGMTGANFNLVTVKVELGENDPEPRQHLEDGEHIVTRVVPLKDLSSTLDEYVKKGFIVDGLVGTIALGLKLAAKYT